MQVPHLVYFADPMCSWCWGFSPAIAAIEQQYGDALPIRLILGGLRPYTTEPMDPATMAQRREGWQRVGAASGQPFDLRFFDRERFVYDTEPASRAAVVLRRRSAAAALEALRRLQSAFYAENRDVTQTEVLGDIAAEMGADRTAFLAEFESAAARDETRQDFTISQQVGVRGFPTLIAGTGQGNSYDLLTNGFQPAPQVLQTVAAWLAQHGVAAEGTA